MLKKVAGILCAGFIITMLFAGCKKGETVSNADQSWQQVSEKKSLVVGVDVSQMPMAYTTGSSSYAGFDVSLAQEAANRLNLTVTFREVKNDQAVQALENGTVDCIWSGFTYSATRDEDLTLSVPYLTNRHVLMVTNESEAQNLADLSGKKLGVVTASSAQQSLDATELFKTALAEIKEYDLATNAVAGLRAGEVDVLAIDETTARYYINADGDCRLIMDTDDKPETLGEHSVVIAFRRGAETLKSKVEEAMKTMARDSVFSNYSNAWFGADITNVSSK